MIRLAVSKMAAPVRRKHFTGIINFDQGAEPNSQIVIFTRIKSQPEV